ncbi:MAG: T9SS type A sorting domain-containing protein [Bacteroidia bacterium]|nr:T9SS type A sorting domain-containing protein [Bacteroidia bacterium]
MKKIILLSFFLCTVCLLSAQNFVPPGTSWYFSNQLFGHFWEHIQYEKDTLLNGISCMKMTREHQEFYPTPEQGWHAALPAHSVFFLKQSNDTVYLYDGQEQMFRILYIYNLSVGSVFETNEPDTFGPGCVLYHRTTVKSSGTLNINGKTLNYWELGGDGDSSYMALNGLLVEKVGMFSGYFFPTLSGYSPDGGCPIIDGYNPRLSCFESDSIGFYRDPQFTYDDCKYYLGTAAVPGPSVTMLYPNPAPEQVVLQTSVPGTGQVRIFDMQGHRVAEILNAENGTVIRVAHLPAGVYWAEVYTADGSRSVHKLIKQ